MSRKSKSHRRSRKSKRSHRRTRRQGGADALSGAPVNYHLAGSWPSKMSLGQGTDYFKYHERQHGGAGAPLSAITDSMLPAPLRGPAHIGGIDAAIAYSRQFKDQAGGKRHRSRRARRSQRSKRSRRSQRSKRSRRSQKKQGGRRRSHCARRSQRKQRRSRGGALGYAPFPNQGMLLDSKMAYAQAGLNPQWKTDVAFDAAAARQKISP